MRPPIIMHVNYVEQGQTVDEMCRKAVDLGFDGVEFRSARRGLMRASNLTWTSCRGLNRSGLEHVIFGFPAVTWPTPMPPIERISSGRRSASTARQPGASRSPLQTALETSTNPIGALFRRLRRRSRAVAGDDHWACSAEGFRCCALPLDSEFRPAFETTYGLPPRPSASTARRCKNAYGLLADRRDPGSMGRLTS